MKQITHTTHTVGGAPPPAMPATNGNARHNPAAARHKVPFSDNIYGEVGEGPPPPRGLDNPSSPLEHLNRAFYYRVLTLEDAYRITQKTLLHRFNTTDCDLSYLSNCYPQEIAPFLHRSFFLQWYAQIFEQRSLGRLRDRTLAKLVLPCFERCLKDLLEVQKLTKAGLTISPTPYFENPTRFPGVVKEARRLVAWHKKDKAYLQKVKKPNQIS